jgi:hypothetical protein
VVSSGDRRNIAVFGCLSKTGELLREERFTARYASRGRVAVRSTGCFGPIRTGCRTIPVDPLQMIDISSMESSNVDFGLGEGPFRSPSYTKSRSQIGKGACVGGPGLQP